MALLFFDGFDDAQNNMVHYIRGTNFNGTKGILCPASGSRTSGKFSGYAIYGSGFFIELENSVSTIFIALDVKPDAYRLGYSEIIRFINTGFAVVWFFYTGIAIYDNIGNMVASKSIAWIPTAFNWLSIRYTVSSTSGLIEVKDAHGDVIVSYSGNTRGSATSDNVLQILKNYGTYTACHVDSIYVMDSSGPAPFNGHLTETRVIQLLPNAPGDLTEWSAVGADTVLDAVREVEGNDDNDYAFANTDGQRFLVGAEDIPAEENNIIGVVVKSRLKRDDAGIWRVAHLVKTGGNVYESAQTPITNAVNYLNVLHPFPNNPDTGNAWTIDEINSLQIGMKAYLG